MPHRKRAAAAAASQSPLQKTSAAPEATTNAAPKAPSVIFVFSVVIGVAALAGGAAYHARSSVARASQHEKSPVGDDTPVPPASRPAPLRRKTCLQEGTVDTFATFGKWAPLKHGERRKVCIRGEPDIEVEGLSEASPTAFLVRGLMKPGEIGVTLKLTEPHLKDAVLGTKSGKASASPREQVSGGEWRKSKMLTMNARDSLRSLNNRVSQLFEYSLRLVVNSTVQIQRYQKGGRYFPHYDSRRLELLADSAGANPKMPTGFPYSGRIATIVLYMDTPASGHTFFPFSNLSRTHTPQEAYNIAEYLSPKDPFRRPRNAAFWEKYCRDPTKHGGLAVKPKKGDAVVFFNHELEQGADGEAKLGELDPFSFHGGCVVKDEEKTMMNYWVNIDPAHFSTTHTPLKVGDDESVIYAGTNFIQSVDPDAFL